MVVLADLGCRTGFFSIPAARRVKKVFAFDIAQEMLDILNQDMHKTVQFIFLSYNRRH
jgi:predicted RNA methylase